MARHLMETGHIRESELVVMVKDSEDQAELENLRAKLALSNAQRDLLHANPSIGAPSGTRS